MVANNMPIHYWSQLPVWLLSRKVCLGLKATEKQTEHAAEISYPKVVMKTSWRELPVTRAGEREMLVEMVTEFNDELHLVKDLLTKSGVY